MAAVLVIRTGFLVPKAAAQSDKYPKMAPVDRYLMERSAEGLLARSAAPDSISSDATIRVLGRRNQMESVNRRHLMVALVPGPVIGRPRKADSDPPADSDSR